MSDKPPLSTTDLYQAIDRRRRGRSTDELDKAERLARLGQWRNMPLTVGLALALIAGAWKVWDMRDELERRIRHEIAVHDLSTEAHLARVGQVREAWTKCLELERRIGQLEAKTGELASQPRRRRR